MKRREEAPLRWHCECSEDISVRNKYCLVVESKVVSQ